MMVLMAIVVNGYGRDCVVRKVLVILVLTRMDVLVIVQIIVAMIVVWLL